MRPRRRPRVGATAGLPYRRCHCLQWAESPGASRPARPLRILSLPPEFAAPAASFRESCWGNRVVGQAAGYALAAGRTPGPLAPWRGCQWRLRARASPWPSCRRAQEPVGPAAGRTPGRADLSRSRRAPAGPGASAGSGTAPAGGSALASHGPLRSWRPRPPPRLASLRPHPARRRPRRQSFPFPPGLPPLPAASTGSQAAGAAGPVTQGGGRKELEAVPRAESAKRDPRARRSRSYTISVST